MNDFERDLRAQLQALERHIDPATASKLAACRHAALRQLPNPIHRRSRWLPSVTGAALACGLALWVMAPKIDFNAGTETARASVESVELYEHLDFYSWLANSQWEPEQG